MKNNLNIKIKEMIIPIILIIFIVLLSIFVLFPKAKEVLDMRKNISIQEKKINVVSEKFNNLSNLSEAELYDSSSLLLQTVPSSKNFTQFLGSVRKTFFDSGVTIESFDLSPGIISSNSASLNNEKGFSNILMTVNFISTYENFQILIKNLEKTIPLVEVDTIKFNAINSPGGSSDINVSGKITLITFFSPLPKTISPYDSPLQRITSTEQKLVEELKTYNLFVPEALNREFFTIGKENPFSF